MHPKAAPAAALAMVSVATLGANAERKLDATATPSASWITRMRPMRSDNTAHNGCVAPYAIAYTVATAAAVPTDTPSDDAIAISVGPNVNRSKLATPDEINKGRNDLDVSLATGSAFGS